MKRLSFRGGIHPPYRKELTSNCSIKKILPGKTVYIPLQQHLGAVCSSLVSKGDTVKMGDKIGESEAFVSSPVHSSVSGKVLEIKKHLHPNGTMVETVVIENDFLYQIDKFQPKTIEEMTPEEIVNAVKEAGIVGMGGAGFPIHIKIAVPKNKKVDCLIINGAECEPYLSSDHRVMVEKSEKIIYGVRALMKSTGAPRALIGVEDNKQDAIDALTKAIEKDPAISVQVLKTKYPQGSEKHIIKATFGREVPSGKLPLDVGVIVNNIDTCISVANAIGLGVPVTRRRVTISGEAVNEPGVYEFHIGMTFGEAIEAAGGLKPNVAKILMGGPMMGIAQFDTSVPIIKTTSGILALSSSEARSFEESNCLRCGKCVDVCPMNLLPLTLSYIGRTGQEEKAVEYCAQDCIECGCCSFVCPSRRYLVESIRLAKALSLTRIRNGGNKA